MESVSAQEAAGAVHGPPSRACLWPLADREELKPLLEKSDATKSRAGISLSVDNSVIDRLGRLLRCTWSWYSGRAKDVVNGQDLLGIVLTVAGNVFPLHLLFASKQGRANTDLPAVGR